MSLFYPANPVAEVRRVAVCRIVAVDGRVQKFEKMKEGKEPLATPGPYPLSATFLGYNAWPWSWSAAVGFLLFCLIKSKRGNSGKTRMRQVLPRLCPVCSGCFGTRAIFDISRQHHDSPMATFARSSLLPQCTSCARRYTRLGFEGWRPLQQSQQQIRGKQKLAKPADTVTVKLLKDVRRFGRKGRVLSTYFSILLLLLLSIFKAPTFLYQLAK